MLWCLSDRPTDAGSHIWYYAAQPKQMLHDKLDQESLSEYAQPLFAPQSKAAARQVTLHGNYPF